MPAHSWLKLVLCALPLAWLWLTLINQLRIPWSLSPQYAYGWAVPFLCLYLLWVGIQKTASRFNASTGQHINDFTFAACPRFVIPVYVFCALILLPVRLIAEANPGWSLVTWPLALITISLTLLLASRCGFRVSAIAFPLFFFLVAVPWPFIAEDFVIQGLTRLNTALTVEILGLMNIPAIPHGNVIELATGTVGIDEACSGIRSLQATLMISLFLGELYRIAVLRRIGLCLAGFGIAMICNLARMLLLCGVAAHRGVEAIAGWHDPAGVTILVACFLTLWALTARLRPPAAASPRSAESPATANLVPGNATGVHSPPSATLSAFGLSVLLLVWLLLVEVVVAAWYHRIESNLPAQVVWDVAWPPTNDVCRDVPLSHKAAEMLRYDAARQVQWLTPEGDRFQLSWFYWKPGRAAGYLAKGHNPLICMPASGFGITEISPVQFATIPLTNHAAHPHPSPLASIGPTNSSFRLPFRIYRFDQDGRAVHILYSRWEDRTTAQSFVTEGTTRFSRLQSVWRGRGNHGQRVVTLALWGESNGETARQRLLRQLQSVIVSDSLELDVPIHFRED